jgi:hypothetical protein
MAEAIARLVPGCEMVRMVNSGTEATLSAIRLARGATGRARIVKFEGCYHGHGDSLLVKAGSGALTFGQPSSAGVPPEIANQTVVLPYNDIDALDAAFYKTFRTIEPTGKRTMLALDVSGSMSGGQVAGVPGLTPRDASAAMSLITAATETNHGFVGFSTKLIELPISPRQRLDDVIKVISGLPFAGTDCALPMTWALQHRREVDTFVVYTDSETWAGSTHPSIALRKYREKMGIDAKLIVVGMTSNGFTIADPDDAGMLDVVGFDTATPSVIADFANQAVRAQA